MTVLSNPIFLMNICGLNPYKIHQLPYCILKYVWGVTMFYNFIPQVTNFIYNMDNIGEASEILNMVVYSSISLLKFVIFISNAKLTKQLIVRTRTIVERESDPMPVNGNFQSTEMLLNKIFKFYQILTAVIFVVAIIIPIILQVYKYSVGEATPETYVNLAKTRYFFDTSTTPTYQITMILSNVGFVTTALATEVIICLFFSVCLYIRAFYRELRFKLNQLNEKEMTNKEMQDALKVYINFHIEIMEFIKLTTKIYRWIIFTEFLSIIFNICVYFFQTSLMRSSGNTLSYGFYIIVIFAHLFLLCSFGSIVAEEGYHTTFAIYNLNWYEYNKDTRNMIRLMIKQSQNFNGICVAKIIKCNLETFIKIINISYSIFTIFRSIVKKHKF